MPITNTSSGALDNEHNEFSLSISDTNAHDLPDTDGDDSSGGDPWDGRTASTVVAYVTNAQDQDLTATLFRAPEPGSVHEVADVSSVTVASGDTEALIATQDAPMGAFRVEVTFTSAPSGSNDTTVTFDFEAGE